MLARHQSGLLAAAAVALLGYLAPPVHLLLLPLQYLNTHLHEMCHALMALATGGDPQRILVFGDGSGVTPILGGNGPLEASAGYTGATVIGAAMIYFGRTPERAKTVLYTVAGLLTLSLILWVRGDAVGLASGWFWAAALFCAARFVKGIPLLFICQLVGLEQCLNSISSVYQLLQISVYTESQSDAKLMQGFTSIPAAAWATLWCLFSLLMVGLTVRKAWNQKAPSPVAKPAAHP
jgi:hypothetical protein